MSVGTELRQARERAGLSAEQIGERTKIQLHKIEALENGNFEPLPAGIYLDGIVRAYAREVAIEPEPLIQRVRDERLKFAFAVSSDVAPAGLDGFDSEEVLTSEPGTPPTIDPSQESIPREWDVIGASDPHDIGALDRALAEDSDPAVAPARREPAGPARGLGRLALPVVSLLAAAGWGAYFYRTMRPLDRDATPHIAASAPQPAGPTDIAIPDATATPPQGAPPDQTIAGTTAPPERSIPDIAPGSAPPELPAEPPGKAATSEAPKSGTVGSVRDVSGSWRLATRVESSTYAPFADLRLGYEIQLEQTGDRVTGAGRKVSENDGEIDTRAQTPISVAGTIDGDRLTLTFTERGARRPTQGKFVLLFEEGGTLRGRFSSTAAQSSGTVEAHRVPR